MGLETVNFIDDLVITNPPDSDLRSEGAAHLRGIKTGLKASFPNVTEEFNVQRTDWILKATTYEALPFQSILADTSGGVWTLTLPPSPTAGKTYVNIKDYAGTWGTNTLTIGRNGNLIEALAEDMTCTNSNASFTLCYIDGTRGWGVFWA